MASAYGVDMLFIRRCRLTTLPTYLIVWNLNGKFLLDSHDHLDSVERVETQVASKARTFAQLIAEVGNKTTVSQSSPTLV